MAQLLGVPEGKVGNAVATLERTPGVLYAEPDLVVRAWAVPDDPRFAELWGLRNTGQAVAGGSAGTPGADANVTPAGVRGQVSPYGSKTAVFPGAIGLTCCDLTGLRSG